MVILFVHDELYVLLDELVLAAWFSVSNMVNELSVETLC